MEQSEKIKEIKLAHSQGGHQEKLYKHPIEKCTSIN
jgi:hypothetical protein